MLDDQQNSLSRQVFKNIADNRWQRNKINNEFMSFQKKRNRELVNYQGLKGTMQIKVRAKKLEELNCSLVEYEQNPSETVQFQSERTLLLEKSNYSLLEYQRILNESIQLEAERALLFEKSNYNLLEYQQALQICDLYLRRAKAFLNCVVSLSNQDYEEFKKYSNEFAIEIGKQALLYKKMEIQKTRQKRIIDIRKKQWFSILEKKNSKNEQLKEEKWNTTEKINSENIQLFDLEEEQGLMMKIFQNGKIELQEEDFNNTNLIDKSPLEVAKKVYPELNQLSQLNEQRGRINK